MHVPRKLILLDPRTAAMTAWRLRSRSRPHAAQREKVPMYSSWKSALRLAPYIRHYKLLLLTTLLVGLAGFAVGFFLPWRIGTAIDRVIRPVAPDGTAFTTESRVRWLVIILIVGVIIVPLCSLATYWRGHL